MSIELYTRDGCNGCERVKQLLNFHGIAYEEIKLDVDITGAEVRERFPSHPHLPILVDGYLTYSTVPVIEKVLNEYKSELGKEFLIEGDLYNGC